MEYTDECWHCAGQRTVKKATGKAVKCGECKGTGAMTYGEEDDGQKHWQGRRK